MDQSAGLTSVVTRGRRNPLHFGLPKRLRAARDGADLGTAQLSLAAGLANGVAALVEGGTVPQLDTLEKLARPLNISPCYLAFGVEAPPIEGDVLASAAIGTRLQQVREAQGLGLRALARVAEVNPTTISNIEARRTVPSVATAEKLAKALKVDPCWLSYGQGEAPDLPPGQ